MPTNDLPLEVQPYYFTKRNILIVGATGLIGTQLYRIYKNEGHTIKILSTNAEFVVRNDYAYYWNVDEGIVDKRAFDDIDVIVNLAGAGIADGLWTKKRKKLIYDSRVKGTKLLAESFLSLNKELKFYMGASAVGFYGPNNNGEAKEESAPRGEGFLADVCADWEEAHKLFESVSGNFIIARLSNVVAPAGGFMLPFLMASKFGFRIYFGKHDHLVSWIHLEDAARFFSSVLYMDFKGTFNLVVESRQWTIMQNTIYDSLGDQLIRLTIPNKILKLMMGEMASLMLDGNNASGGKAEDFGFMIKHLDLRQTILTTRGLYYQ